MEKIIKCNYLGCFRNNSGKCGLDLNPNECLSYLEEKSALRDSHTGCQYSECKYNKMRYCILSRVNSTTCPKGDKHIIEV